MKKYKPVLKENVEGLDDFISQYGKNKIKVNYVNIGLIPCSIFAIEIKDCQISIDNSQIEIEHKNGLTRLWTSKLADVRKSFNPYHKISFTFNFKDKIKMEINFD